MRTAFRMIGAVVVGFVVLLVLLIVVELFSELVHPFPAGRPKTEAEICKHVERYPAWVLAACIPMWGFAALASTWIAGRIGNVWTAAIVGLLLLTALGCNLWMLPYPAWFKITCFAALVFAVFAGVYVHPKRPPTVAVNV